MLSCPRDYCGEPAYFGFRFHIFAFLISPTVALDLNIVTIMKNNLIRVGVERGYIVILEYVSRSSEKLFHGVQRTIIPANGNVNEITGVKRKAEIYFNLSLFCSVFFKVCRVSRT